MTGSASSPTTSRPAAPKRANAKRRKKKAPGWVPDQHGAWFMVTVPALTGALLAPSWTTIPLLLTWWLGYFTFFAASWWIRSRFREKHRPPVLVYGAMAAVAGVVTLLMRWELLVWVPLFAPLVLIAVYEAWRRRPRSLLSGVSTVLAACLVLPVIAWAGDGLDAKAWTVAAVYAVYFLGTVPYVKTLIRERGERDWFLGSVGYHVVAIVAAVAAAVLGVVHWAVVAVAVVILARAWGMPVSGAKRDKPWTPKQVGMLEGLITLFVAIAALL